MARPAQRVEMIPIDRITIVNPRLRSKKIFKGIVENIAEIGLKRPITVTSRQGADGPLYDLVCGQGRLEAYVALGQTEIPAIVVEGTKEDLLLMSLAENLARRQHTTVELVREIRQLKERGYKDREIAVKTDLDVTYVRGILQLLAKGEDRLLYAVEKGHLPISIAITIATTDDKSVQQLCLFLRNRSVGLSGRYRESLRKDDRRKRGAAALAEGEPAPTPEIVTTVGAEQAASATEG